MMAEYEDVEDNSAETENKELENFADLIQWENNPEVKKFGRAFNKDVVLSNLSDQGVRIVSEHFELSRETELLKLEKASKFLFACGLDFVILSNARKGFARKQAGTNRMEYQIEGKEEAKTKLLPELRKKKKQGGGYYE